VFINTRDIFFSFFCCEIVTAIGHQKKIAYAGTDTNDMFAMVLRGRFFWCDGVRRMLFENKLCLQKGNHVIR